MPAILLLPRIASASVTVRAANHLFVSLVLLLPARLVAEEQMVNAVSAEPRFQIEGRVVDEEGRPLAGAEVESLREGETASDQTDEAGHFVLNLPRKPRQVLLLRAVGSGGARQAFAAFLLDEKVRYMVERHLSHVDVGLPNEIKLVARPPRRIDVVVVDGEKRPLANVTVFAAATQYQKIAHAVTDAGGKASLMVPSDAPLYSIVAMKSGVGLDYFLYQSPVIRKRDGYRLARDHAGPITLALNGMRRVTVKVVDEKSLPLAGVKVSPWYVQKPRKGLARAEIGIGANLFDGGALDTSEVAEYLSTTNKLGQATLDWVPADCMESISLVANAPGYMKFGSTFVDVGSGENEASMVLMRVLSLHGQVKHGDGRPAADARVSIFQDALDDGRDAGPSSGRSRTTFTDDQGAFQVEVSVLRED